MIKLIDGALASSAALLTMGVQNAQQVGETVAQAVKGSSLGDLVTVVVVGIVVPIIKDQLVNGAMWLIKKIFKKKQV